MELPCTSWIKLFSLVQVVTIFKTSDSVDFRETTDKTTYKVNNWNADCPSQCYCYKGTPFLTVNEIKYMNTVDCSNTGLENLPMILPEETEVLLITNNNVTKLSWLPFAPNLYYLDLSNSSIGVLEKNNLFLQVKKLKYLNLSGNNLSNFQPFIFAGLMDLYDMDLSNNKLSNIAEAAFAGLNQLKSLNFAYNLLERINPDWFKDLSSDLRELDISNNHLTFIDRGDLCDLNNLNLLNLSYNTIRIIENCALCNLTNIIILDLSYNQLQFVPKESLQHITSLKKLILNGNNIYKIHTGDFRDMYFQYLSISFMPRLVFIEKFAFQNLSFLVTIEAHDNHKLIYIDPKAFSDVPRLSTLYLHNNQLAALSPSLIQYVPSLDSIHLYRNPLQCDCNAFWIRETIQEAIDSNFSKPYFNHSKFLKCDFPLNLTGTSIEDIDERKFKRVCAPTVLSAFKENYTLNLGEELRLECHAYGIPEPKVTWLLPNQTEITGDFHNRKFEINDDCVLIMRYLTEDDSGTYACKADNGIAFDTSSTRITVTNKPVRLLIFRVSFDYISLSWNGTKHNSMISDYQLQYTELKGDNNQNSPNQNQKYKIIPLGPQYRSYTVTHLKPKTAYEFCIVYVYDTERYKVDCRVLETRDKIEYHSAIKKIVSEKIIAGVCTALGIVMAVACMVTLVKKFKLHKDYESPYNTDETESINIPLENVYRPTTSHLCSSKTSLLSVQSHKSCFDEY